MLADLRLALRSLAKTPGFAGTAILILALGIGATTAVFSVIDAVLLRPLPYPEPHRLVAVWEQTRMFGLHYSPPAAANFVDWRRMNSTFADMGASEGSSGLLASGGETQEVYYQNVTASLFTTLQVQPELGRLWRDGEDQPGAARTVILSHAFWQQQYGGDSGIIGRTLQLDGKPYTVLGVMPRGFGFPTADVAFWASAGSSNGPEYWQDRGRHNLLVVGRLKPGVTLAQANSDLRQIAAQLRQAYPGTNTDLGTFAAPLREHVAGPVRRLYAVLLGAVGLLLLLACTNLGSLLLARMLRRRHEVAIRLALGGSHGRIWRHSLLENFIIGALGAGAGLLVASWTMALLQPLVPAEFTAVAPLTLDRTMLGFALAAALVAVLLTSGAPWALLSRMDAHDALQQASQRSSTSARSSRLQSSLVVGQLAISVVLLIGAGLLLRTFLHLRSADLGFHRDQIVVTRLSAIGFWSDQRREPPQREAFYREALQRIGSLAGVAAAGFTSGAPLLVKHDMTSFLTEEAIARQDFQAPSVNDRAISAGYFGALGTPILRGRALSERDRAGAPLVAVVNEALARQYWPGVDALGRRFKRGGTEGPWITVVGIVADVRQAGIDAAPKAEMYLSCLQQWQPATYLVVRGTGDPAALGAALRRELAAFAPDLPVVESQPMQAVVARELAPRRLQMLLVGALAGVALLLAGVGLYGIIAYAVESRTREFGVRSALGATQRDIALDVLKSTARLVAIGAGCGLASAWALARAIGGVLYGVEPRDLATYGVATALVVVVALVASWLPARRATRVDPLTALRAE